MLDVVQRSVALKACRAHRTVSLHSALILSKLLSLDIRMREAAWLYDVKRGKDLGDTFVDRELETHSGPSGRGRSAIYTDGSRIEGKVDAALTEWRDGEETWCSALRLDPFCTVFQAEMIALQRAIRRVKNGKDGLVNVFGDSPRSLRKMGLSLILERYAEGSTGEITKCFFPRVEQAYRVLRKVEITSQMAQTLTGHGGFAQYLHRFKLKDSSYCACDPAKILEVLHVLQECQCFCGSVWHWKRKSASLSGGGNFQ
ncbi:hypothetical protein EVAR_72839_1 [Eumeta japonica]|uniref:Uncharacterized protein n=1 Tax=Eumeta variegata TaxID=151549 RepID=A0A4C1TRD2_EUMVA|nr:hypothetical protein EVAR_72839_1 [Eumeta japonica]